MDPTWQGLVFTFGVHSFSFFIINFIFKKTLKSSDSCDINDIVVFALKTVTLAI